MNAMALDWTNERYVRAYTRDTGKWLRLSWQARALFWELLRKADRSGVIEATCAEDVAVLIRWPDDTVTAALPELLADGCVTECDGGFLIRNYLEAQETPISNAQRLRDLRERRKTQKETARNAEKRGNTEQHSDPIRSDPSDPYLSSGGARKLESLWWEICQTAVTDLDRLKEAWTLIASKTLAGKTPEEWARLLLLEFVAYRNGLEQRYQFALSIDKFAEHFNRCEERAKKRVNAPEKRNPLEKYLRDAKEPNAAE